MVEGYVMECFSFFHSATIVDKEYRNAGSAGTWHDMAMLGFLELGKI